MKDAAPTISDAGYIIIHLSAHSFSELSILSEKILILKKSKAGVTSWLSALQLVRSEISKQ